MSTEGKDVAVKEALTPAAQDFNLLNRKALGLAMSGLMPKDYTGNSQEAIAKCLIAAEMADRMGMNAVSVAQNLHIIQGKPSWSSTFVIAAINHSGVLKGSLRFVTTNDGIQPPVTYDKTYWAGGQKKTKSTTVEGAPHWTCYAEGTCAVSGAILKGPTVTMEMAILEGWYDKDGSKWKTMPELMIQYRAGAFFGRLYAPELLAGLHHADEVEDMRPARVVSDSSPLEERLNDLVEAEEVVDAEVVDEEEAGEQAQREMDYDANEGTEHID